MTPLECLKMLLNDGWLNVDNAEFAVYDLKTMKTVGDVVREAIEYAESSEQLTSHAIKRHALAVIGKIKTSWPASN